MGYAPGMRESVRTKERASERLEVRIKPSERAALDRAANASGEPVSTIVINGALREAARLERLAKSTQQGG